jgi:hypothetical protein
VELSFDILIPWIENERGFVREKIMIGKKYRVHSLI